MIRVSKVEWILDYYEGPKRIRKWSHFRGELVRFGGDLNDGVRWWQGGPLRIFSTKFIPFLRNTRTPFQLRTGASGLVQLDISTIEDEGFASQELLP